MFKASILAALLTVSLQVSILSQGVVRGTVTESGSGQTLPGVHVVFGVGEGTVTDGAGVYSIKAPAGQLSVTFRFVGYRAEKREVSISATDTIILDIELSPDVTTLNEIVVSAGRAEQRLSELTVSMTVIKPYIISRNHIISADELLNRTPGVEILDGQASVRGGSGYSYGAGSRVMALIDGLPALSADAGNIKWNTLPLENISRIEVIKGASSVLYGSSALNGIVNFITREATEEPVTTATVSAGIYDKPSRDAWKWWGSPRTIYSASLSHSKLYGSTGVGLGLKLFETNGYRKLDDEKYARVSLRLKKTSEKNKALSYGMNLNTTLTDRTDFLLWEDAAQGALKQSPATAMPFRGTSVAIDPFFAYGGAGKVEHRVNMRLMSNLNRLPDNSNNNSDSYSLFSEYQFSSGKRGMFAMVAGASQQYINIGSNFYGDHWGWNVAGYAQFEASPLSWLRGVAGVRLEEYILDGEAEKLIPIFRAGLNATLAEATFLRASIGQGYRYPSVAEKHAYTTVGSIKILPNYELKSESGWSSEIGLKQGFSVYSLSGQADIALFYSENQNLIEFVFGYWYDIKADEFTYGFNPTNIENSRVYGAEAEVMMIFSTGRLNNTLTAGYTFMYPVEFNGITGRNTGEYLKFRRKHSAELNILSGYGRFEAGTSLSVKSRILEIDDVFLAPTTREAILPGFYDYWLGYNKGHIVVDFFAGYRFTEGYQASLGIKNLTNTEYMGRPGDVMPHRYYSIQISGRF